MATSPIALTRPEITKLLTHAAVMHFVKLRYGVYTEMGLSRKGSIRSDVLAINYRKHVVLIEVKSSYADWAGDSKWPSYLGFCDQLYFLVPQYLWDSGKITARGKGTGVMVLDEKTGHLRVVVKARVQELMTDEERMELILRMAYRGDFTSRNIKRRNRVFLTKQIK